MKRLFLCILAGFLLCPAPAEARTPIDLLSAPARGLSASRVIDQIRSHFDVDRYREVRVLIKRDSAGRPDHLLILFLIQGMHRVETAWVKLGPDLSFVSTRRTFDPEAEIQPLASDPSVPEPQCPDRSVEFIAFAPNNDDLEQQITEEVAQAAEAAKLKTVRLFRSKATRQSYLNYMTCPSLKGNFYNGDADPSLITTVDGYITASEIRAYLASAFKYHVTNIWLACQAYNDPMLSAVHKSAQTQKYAAGINNLAVGPSDRAAACAMKAALRGQAMTQAFWDCYKKFDESSDQWGFSGDGADFFGK